MSSETIPSRGDVTRQALLRAATEIFGRDGYHAASTRSIAQEAGVNQALIGYHYGGKHGLYLAVFEEFNESVAARVAGVAAEVRSGLDLLSRDSDNRVEVCTEYIERILMTMLETMQEPGMRSWARLMMREQQDPTEGIGILYQGVFGEMQALLARAVALAAAEPLDSQMARLRALMLLGEVVVFISARATTARQMGWQDIGPRELGLIRKQLHNNVQALFSAGETS